ncbi:AbfB domain-containing protein [Nucisporomicrobium flavum]|uniref:AbfB domain-containing protein n=1 Tax=Nucisporomicrobium flavum TaxID=2785915 RepID=UPI0018F4EB33|nr:AbfB domain-containing protein [Nucisporomicrobium flavum]
MSTEDQSRTAELRVGGWVPPYRQSATGPSPLPDAFLAAASAAVPQPGRPSGAAGPDRRSHRAVIAACAALAVLAVTGVMAYESGHTTRPGPPRFVALPVVPTVPVPPLGPASASPSAGPAERSLAANPIGSASASASAHSPAPTASSVRPSASPSEARPRPTRTRAPERRGPFTIGRGVGLEPAGMTGYRVRHRDFRARIDRIDAGSPSLDRADSTFTVRAGLAGTGCVSFESVNYPGSFLRHRDGGIWLDRRDGTGDYAGDATFCPQAGRGTDTVLLSSQNQADRFLSLRRGRLGLSGWPVAFTVRPPL